MSKKYKKWPKLSVYLVLFSIILVGYPWQGLVSRDSLRLDGTVFKTGTEEVSDVKSQILYKNYSFPKNVYLEGELKMGMDELLFRDLKKLMASYPQEDEFYTELEEYQNNSPEILSDGNWIGFAWSNQFGLVSLSSENTADKAQEGFPQYAVKVKNGKMSGYAWNDKIGWICFGECKQKVAGLDVVETSSSLAKFVSLVYSVKFFLAGGLSLFAVSWAFYSLAYKKPKKNWQFWKWKKS